MNLESSHRVLLVGDTHGNWHGLNELLLHEAGNFDIVISLGDFGFWPRPGEVGKTWGLTKIKCPVPLLWIDGNHERHDILTKLVSLHGREPISLVNNIYYLPRGCLLKIGNKNCLAVGGAHSIDKMYRREGVDWFAEENVNYGDCQAVLSHEVVDVVFAHTIPDSGCDHIFKTMQNMIKFEEICPTRKLLDEVVAKYKPESLYAGHWHCSTTFKVLETTVRVFDCFDGDWFHPRRKGIVYDILEF